MFFKLSVLKTLRHFAGKHLRPAILLKKTPAPGPSCETLKNNFFTKHFRQLLLEGVGEGASLVKIFQDCHFNIYGMAIYKTRNTGTGNGMRGTECGERGECSLGFWGISQRILGNVIFLTFGGMFKKILGNVQKDSGECSKRFRRMLRKIPGNVKKYSRECY